MPGTQRYEIALLEMPDKAVLLRLREVGSLFAVEKYPVAEQFALGALVKELARLVEQAHGALADDRHARRRSRMEDRFPLRVVSGLQLAGDRRQIVLAQGIERRDRAQKIDGQADVVHGKIVRPKLPTKTGPVRRPAL